MSFAIKVSVFEDGRKVDLSYYSGEEVASLTASVTNVFEALLDMKSEYDIDVNFDNSEYAIVTYGCFAEVRPAKRVPLEFPAVFMAKHVTNPPIKIRMCPQQWGSSPWGKIEIELTRV